MLELPAHVARHYFKAATLPADTFQVLRFQGVEALSQPFRFELLLAADDPDLAFADVVDQPAALVLLRGAEPRPIFGVVSQWRLVDRTPDAVHYQALLMPRLSRLAHHHRSRIFQHTSVPDIVAEVFQQDGFGAADLRFDLKGPYAPREYCVQYQETDLAFVQRLLEHEGLCYYIEHTDERDVVVVTDDRFRHPAIAHDVLPYREPNGTVRSGEEFVAGIQLQEQTLPGQVAIRDYHAPTPETDVSGEAVADDAMPGEHYEYAPHAETPAAAKRLAQVRAEELACRRRTIRGRCSSPALRCGYTFELAEHYRADLNERYLVTRLVHEGRQQEAMAPGVAGGDGAADGAGLLGYRTTFTATPARVQYRPPRVTPVPRVHGLQTGRLESAGGPYAHIDDDGRYRAKMHFDRSGATDGNATLPLRMAQPYAGSNYGMHFPNHAGVEVVWACIDGDVDRPILLGAAPNPSTASPATAANKWQNVIRTWGQNELTFDDAQGEENIYLHATKDRTTEVTNDHAETVGHDQAVRVENDRTKSIGHDETTDVGNDRTESVGNDETIDIGNDRTKTVGNNETTTIGTDRTESVGSNETVSIGADRTLDVGANDATSVGADQTLQVGGSQTTGVDGDQTTAVQGNQTIEISGKQDVAALGAMALSSQQKITLQANVEITLQVGPSSITIGPDGITLSGPKIASSAMAMNEITGGVVKIN